MVVEDVHLLTVHEPYRDVDHPGPINATIVHALTLLHPRLPQPDSGLVYRCLTEFPGRTPGCLVPMSTLTFELAGGRLWPRIADRQKVSDAVVDLARLQACDALPLGLSPDVESLLAGGPASTVTVHRPDGSALRLDGVDRQRHLDELTAAVRSFVAQAPFWPGDDLLPPPPHPRTLPYHPT
jgi:hypothetical protein